MATLSKREQARNETTLQELLRQSGNSTCADCAARNPAWASWNLGIFLCMRCASIHRKLGTHISKVKSLSMDKWTTDQVESMKQQGNIASNKIYNPKNRKPDIPLDADEVDGAMERYIRKKYQEKSLVDGRPEPPSRTELSPSLTQQSQEQSQYSPDPSMPTGTHGKKHKFFGFSLRTSSKKDRVNAQDAFKVTPVEYSPTSGRVREISDREMQEKLAQLRDMGFGDNERNLDVLKRSGGDLGRSIAMLIKLGPSIPSRQQSKSPAAQSQTRATSSTRPGTDTSNNPFAQLDKQQATSKDPFAQFDQPQLASNDSSSFGISFGSSTQQTSLPSPATSANPWQSAILQQNQPALEQQFSSLAVSNPLFPHHTGGNGPSTTYDPRLQAANPGSPQQTGYASSPTSANPFYPQPLSSQSTDSNPFLQQQQLQQQNQPVFAPQIQNNPFLGIQPPQQYQQQQQNTQHQSPSTNPFGLPPPPQTLQQPQTVYYEQNQDTNPFGTPSQATPQPLQYSQTFPISQMQSQPQQQYQTQPQPQLPNPRYAQPQTQSYAQQSQVAYYQNQQYNQQPQVTQLQPQATGRYTKTDIMALFNAPSPTFQQPLAPVQEGQDDTFRQQPVSPASSNNPYASISPQQNKRSATMPVMSSMHSSGGQGSRNPFMNQSQTNTGQPQSWNQGHRHASNESVSVNNPALVDGRHSPDAFANLSARY